MQTLILLLLITFIGTFIHASVGFGLGLVAMPLLAPLIGIPEAAPLVALQGIALQIAMTLYYRQSLKLSTVGVLAISALAATPFGVAVLGLAPEWIVTGLLGLILIGYALYGLSNPRLPRFEGWGWALGFGAASGLLTGAYNSGGPPMVIFGTAQNWSAEEFKGNLQGVNVIKSVVVILSHAVAGNFSGPVLSDFAWSLPVMAAAFGLGVALDRTLRGERFTRAVLILLIPLGIQLLWTAFA